MRNQDRFWADDANAERPAFVANRAWLVSGISRLIEKGTSGNEDAFGEPLLVRAEAILIAILRNEEAATFEPDSDAVSIAINSPRGRCIEALISLLLRWCRLEDSKGVGHQQVWARLQPLFDEQFASRDSRRHEFTTLFANHLLAFLYFSSDWTLGSLHRAFDETDYQSWLCAIQGYAYVNQVHKPVYAFLRDGGHILKALDDQNLHERVSDKLIQNIVIARLAAFEEAGKGQDLLDKIIERQRVDEVGHVIWFIWTLHKKDDKTLTDKVFQIWRSIVDLLDGASKHSTTIASRLCTWAVFVETVDATTKPLILAIAEHADRDHNGADLLEMIARVSKQQPTEAFEIWKAALSRSRLDYPPEAIEQALRNLIESGADGALRAKKIAGEYLLRSNEEVLQTLQRITAAKRHKDPEGV